jgi:biotin transport system substrate-specific component
MAKKTEIKRITMCAMFTALICVGAYISIPTQPVPITMQTMFVIMAGLMLGSKYGAASCLAYAVLGLAGFPIFSGGVGGLSSVFRPSFGFIIGFIIAAFITGLIIERAKRFDMKTIAIASLSGLAVMYVIGCIYMYIILNVYMGLEDRGVGFVLMNGFLLFMPGEAAKMTLGAVLVRRLKPVLVKI